MFLINYCPGLQSKNILSYMSQNKRKISRFTWNPERNLTLSQQEYCKSRQIEKLGITVKSRSINYTRLEGIFQNIVPSSDKFEKQYQNFCWQAKLNLDHIVSFPKLRKLYAKQIYTTQDVVLAIKYITSQANKKSLICLPSVYIGGFPKSGSTYFYKLLTVHPFVQPGGVKEPHFWTRFPFQNRDDYDSLAVLTYLSNFINGSKCSALNPDCVTVDASQGLLWDTRASDSLCTIPHLAKKFLPNAKFIIIMRNPIDRTYSDFFTFGVDLCTKVAAKKAILHRLFDVRVQEEMKRFRKCSQTSTLHDCVHYTLMTSPHVFRKCGKLRLSVSIYYAHIQKWLQFFSREQFLFIRLDDLIRKPYSVMTQVWSFIGVPSPSKTAFKSMQSLVHQEPNNYPPMKNKSRRALEKFFYPYNYKLAQLLGDEKFLWNDQ